VVWTIKYDRLGVRHERVLVVLIIGERNEFELLRVIGAVEGRVVIVLGKLSFESHGEDDNQRDGGGAGGLMDGIGRWK